MNAIAHHFSSGASFFSGLGLVLAAALASTVLKWGLGRAVLRAVALTGVAFVVLSATPLPSWTYAGWAVLVAAWLILQGTTSRLMPALLRGTAGAACIIMALAELPHLSSPRINIEGVSRLYVLGDSVSVAAREGERPWPQLLAEMQGRPVENLSKPGATFRSAWYQTSRIGPDPCAILLEVGTHNLLSEQPVEKFEADLDLLLRSIRSSRRKLIMFEVPLPPFYNRYGEVQRRLALRYGVSLIPKRVLASVVGGRGFTTDALQPSAAGHEELARQVHEMLRGADAP